MSLRIREDGEPDDVEDTGADANMAKPRELSIGAANLNSSVGGQSHIRDAMQSGPCVEALNITVEEMEKQLEYFSRRLDSIYFERAMAIHETLAPGDFKRLPMLVKTFELYDKAFEFPRVRRYEYVQ